MGELSQARLAYAAGLQVPRWLCQVATDDNEKLLLSQKPTTIQYTTTETTIAETDTRVPRFVPSIASLTEAANKPPVDPTTDKTLMTVGYNHIVKLNDPKEDSLLPFLILLTIICIFLLVVATKCLSKAFVTKLKKQLFRGNRQDSETEMKSYDGFMNGSYMPDSSLQDPSPSPRFAPYNLSLQFDTPCPSPLVGSRSSSSFSNIEIVSLDQLESPTHIPVASFVNSPSVPDRGHQLQTPKNTHTSTSNMETYSIFASPTTQADIHPDTQSQEGLGIDPSTSENEEIPNTLEGVAGPAARNEPINEIMERLPKTPLKSLLTILTPPPKVAHNSTFVFNFEEIPRKVNIQHNLPDIVCSTGTAATQFIGTIEQAKIRILSKKQETKHHLNLEEDYKNSELSINASTLANQWSRHFKIESSTESHLKNPKNNEVQSSFPDVMDYFRKDIAPDIEGSKIELTEKRLSQTWRNRGLIVVRETKSSMARKMVVQRMRMTGNVHSNCHYPRVKVMLPNKLVN